MEGGRKMLQRRHFGELACAGFSGLHPDVWAGEEGQLLRSSAPPPTNQEDFSWWPQKQKGIPEDFLGGVN